MKKIVLFVLLFHFVCGIAQEKVVNKNGKEITVQNPLTNPVTGTGTINYLSKFNGTSTLTNSQLFDNGTNVGIGTTTPSAKFEISSGILGASGLRFTNLTNSTAGASTFSGLLGVNATGDVGIGTVTGSSLSGFTAGQVTFGSATGTLAQSSNFFWDNTNNRLGIGTSTPITSFSNSSSSTNFLGSDGLGMVSNAFTWGAGTAGWGAGIINGNSLAGCNGLLVKVANNTSSTRVLEIGQGTTTTTPLFDVLGNGYIGIGTNAPISQFANTNAIISGNASNNAISGGLTWSTPGTGFSGSFYNSATNGNGMLVKINGTASTQTAFEVLSGTTAATVSNTHFRILGDGKIGIGTSAPNTKLEIASGTAGSSGLRFTNLTNSTAGSSSFSGLLGVNATGDVGIGTVTGSSLSGFTAGQVTFGSATGTLAQSSNLFWDNTGAKFGIGTSTPSNALDINGGLTMRLGNSSLSFANNQIEFGFAGTTDYAHVIKTRHNNASSLNNALDFYVYKFGDAQTVKGGQHVMTMSANGVGIGTTSPAGKLHIGTVDTYASNQTYTGNATNGGLFNVYTNSGNDGGGQTAFSRVLDIVSGSTVTGTSGAGVIRFLTNTNTEGASANMGEKMRIHSNGNVGIGVTTPTQKFVVKGVNAQPASTGTVSNAIVRIDGSTNHALDFGTYSSSPFGSYIQSVDKSNLATSLPLSLNPVAGNVGIGTTSPTNKLHVFGDARFQFNTNNLGTGGDSVWSEFYGKNQDANSQVGGLKLGWYNTYGGIEVIRPLSAIGLGLAFNYATTTTGTTTEGFRLTNTGNVGIGSTNPLSKLEVNGAATNSTAFNAAAGTTIDFSKSNLAYTTASAGAFTLSNMKDGGTYTLAVQGATSGTSTFTATGFTVKYINNGATTASKHTLYTLIVMGTTVYVYMATGF